MKTETINDSCQPDVCEEMHFVYWSQPNLANNGDENQIMLSTVLCLVWHFSFDRLISFLFVAMLKITISCMLNECCFQGSVQCYPTYCKITKMLQMNFILGS